MLIFIIIVHMSLFFICVYIHIKNRDILEVCDLLKAKCKQITLMMS